MEALIEEYGRRSVMLREAIEDLAEEEFCFKPALDKWNIHQIIIHVADSEILSTHRLIKVLAEESRYKFPLTKMHGQKNLRYDLLDREQHLHLFQLLRSSMPTILDHLTVEQSERVGLY
ncbi:DinB family protein [Brevibacillus fluminis]|uniref:DinB family protein n=1 Tax=Brevibacillus fluminis TaxID=511487 RepID=UPI0026C076E8